MPRRQGSLVVESIEPMIVTIRGTNVLLDADLAELYGVSTRRLNEQVKRNPERFPPEFMLELTADEKTELVKSHARLDKLKHSMRSLKAFTEHGTVMAATVLNTPQAVEISLLVVHTFIKLREIAVTHKDLAAKLAELERKVEGHDDSIQALVHAIRQLMAPPQQPTRGKIGFARESES